MIQIEQPQHLQIDQCINNSNPQQLPIVVESSKGLVTQLNNENPAILYSEGNSKLTIRLGTIIIKKLKQTKMKNAKIYSNNQVSKEQTLGSSNIEKRMMMIFSIQDYIQELSKSVQVITIANSRINIHALKKIVRITSKHLKNLRIENCTFYESDNSAIFEREQSSNNKMLRELSFAFQIKALFLPEIDSIEIILKKSSSQESNANSLECKDIIEEASKEQKMREDLAKEYDCHQDSYFVEFELNLKSTLENKYEIGHDQEKEKEIISYILNGNQETKDQIEETINDNIVRDINDHIHAFTKYLKRSLLANKSILIIKEYSLEDPIAQNMIQNMINKYHKEIKTIIFKQTGTIQFDCFRKVIDFMLMVKNLESIAFFDSQPQSNCYELLGELFDIKSFKYIVLNRSFFDIALYKYKVFGEEKIQDKGYNYGIFVTPPKHYAFYILDQTKILEFTPYQHFMKHIVFQRLPNQENLNEQNCLDKKQLEKYQFELLLEDQEKYDTNIQKEIKKYENKEILVFQNVQSEQILVKYRDKLRNNEQVDQQELQNDIITLIKHPSPYNVGLVHLMIQYVKDSTLQNDLFKIYNLSNVFDQINKKQSDDYSRLIELERSQITSSERLMNAVIFEQGLMPCHRQYFQFENQLESAILPIKIEKKIIGKSDDKYQELKFPMDPKQMDSFINNKHLKRILLIMNLDNFTLIQMSEEEGQIISQSLYQNTYNNGVLELLNSTIFSDLLKDLKSLQKKRKDLKIETQITFKSNTSTLIPVFFKILSEAALLELERLVISSKEQKTLTFSLPIKVKKIHLGDAEISNDTFQGQFSCEEIIFFKCHIKESFKINNFKEIKSITFTHCYLNYDMFFKNEVFERLHNQPIISEQQSFQHKNKLSITIKLPVNSDSSQDSEVSLNKETISSIIENQNRLSFQITNLDQKTISEISETCGGNCISEQLQHLINQIIGIPRINHQASSEKEVLKNDQNIVSQQISKFENNVDEQKNIGKLNSYNINSLQLESICKQPGKYYPSNILINEFIKKTESGSGYKDDNFSPKCCVKSLNSNYSSGQENQNLLQFIKEHLVDSDEFCLFKTSISQDMNSPRKIRICFQANFLINDILVYNDEELNNIEELIFEDNKFSDVLYLKFINFIIQSAPNLKSLKFSSIYRSNQEGQVAQPFQILIGNHPNLKKLTIKGFSILAFEFFKCIAIQSNIVQLEQLKFSFYDKEQTELSQIHYEQYIKLAIGQAKDSLRILNVFYFTSEIKDVILKCTKLKKLKLLLQNEQEFSQLNEVLRIQSLEEIVIYTYSYSISDDNFENVLKISQNEQKHLKMISLKVLDRPHDDVSTFYRSSINNDSQEIKNHPSQILQFRNQFKANQNQANQDSNQRNKSIPLEEFLTKYNNNVQQSSDHILSFKHNLTLPFIQLYLNKSFDFKLLNQVFQYSRDSMKLLSFSGCSLNNDSLNQVDFSKLPNNIKYLSFDNNLDLTSLNFLKPLVSCRDSRYYRISLSLINTQVPISEILVYLHYFKKINSDFNEVIHFYPKLQHLFENNNQKSQVVMEYVLRALSTKLNQQELQLFYQIIFQQRISEHKFPLFSLSPLQIISSDFDCKRNLVDILNKQILNISKHSYPYLGNKLILYFALFLKKDQKYLFGYRKNYYRQDFYLYKTQPVEEQSSYKKQITENEHDFFDYLLLTQMQDKTNLKHALFSLSLYVSFQMMHNKQINTNISEEEMIEYLSRIPASEITLEDMSIQFIKIWYVINSISSLTFKTTLKNIDPDVIYNTSIGNYLTQNLHRNNFFRRLMSGNSNKYRFDETVHLLAQYFEKEIKKRKHEYLLAFFPLYLFVCIFGVIFFSLHFNVTCGEGISWYSYITYAIYGIITFYFELLLFKRCLNYISHLIPSLEIDLNPNFIISFVNFIKQSIIDTPWINQWYMGYSYSFFQSQIQRFDNFTNVGFLYSTFECGNYVIFSIALAFMTIPFLYSVYQFNKLIIKSSKKYELPTSSLDTYYRICSLIEFRAVSDILDLVSPSNVICLRGRLFNARIINFFIRIVCESMPLVIIQIYNLTQKEMTSSLVLSLILSIITFLSLLMSVLTITPSTLNQEDFTQMNEKKIKNDTIGKYEERLQRVEDETFALRFYKHLKDIRSKYLKEKFNGNVSYAVAIKYNTNKKYFEIFFDQPMTLITNETVKKQIE